MKRLKAVALLIIAGFFMFAPPGTLIFIAAVIAGWIGGVSAAIGMTFGLVTLAVGWTIIRARRGRKRRPTQTP
jgi:hypothetical protein